MVNYLSELAGRLVLGLCILIFWKDLYMRYTNPTLNGVNRSKSLHTKLPPATNIRTLGTTIQQWMLWTDQSVCKQSYHLQQRFDNTWLRVVTKDKTENCTCLTSPLEQHFWVAILRFLFVNWWVVSVFTYIIKQFERPIYIKTNRLINRAPTHPPTYLPSLLPTDRPTD
jgi:hypothetical protein